MLFQRIIAWFRALFSAPLLETTDDASVDALLSPLPTIEPEITRRQFLYSHDPLRDPMNAFDVDGEQSDFTLEPPLYESPKTIPLLRIPLPLDLRLDQPTQPLPVASEPAPPAQGREPAQSVGSEPLSASLQRLADLPDSADPFDASGSLDALSDLDDMTRRMIFLRRLVRQRVYNEGFSVEQTPDQYRRSHGMRDDHAGPSSHN